MQLFCFYNNEDLGGEVYTIILLQKKERVKRHCGGEKVSFLFALRVHLWDWDFMSLIPHDMAKWQLFIIPSIIRLASTANKMQHWMTLV